MLLLRFTCKGNFGSNQQHRTLVLDFHIESKYLLVETSHSRLSMYWGRLKDLAHKESTKYN